MRREKENVRRKEDTKNIKKTLKNMRKKCGTIELKRLLYLPGGPIISTSHLKISLSSTRPAENPINIRD